MKKGPTVNPRRHRLFVSILALPLLAGLSGGCQMIGPQPTPNLELTRLSKSVSETATANSSGSGSQDELATVQAEATSSSLEISATQTARAAEVPDDNQAASADTSAILAELPRYNLDGENGRLGWFHDPVTIRLSEYHETDYVNDHMNVTAADFVLAADVTWNTQYGTSGCGYMFRSNGDEQNLDQYMLVATRFATGHVAFSALSQGELANLHDFYPKDADSSFQWKNDTTNRLAVVARGNRIEIYSNYAKIGEIDTTQPPKSTWYAPPAPVPPLDPDDQAAAQQYETELSEYQEIIDQYQSNYQTALKNYKDRAAVFDDGFLAFLAVNESGDTVCQFSDAWLWLIEP